MDYAALSQKVEFSAWQMLTNILEEGGASNVTDQSKLRKGKMVLIGYIRGRVSK
jgi:hypothetical protein